MEMTEYEDEKAAKTQVMLEFLQNYGSASKRKFRPFPVACSRRIWDRLNVPGRSAVDVAEKFADGFTGKN